ncbi:MAG: hypothetical protein SFU98_12665 [Leptospiraceae bacterium]|nr:hypothetical protein [Leptospiraceae bacterium]
MSANVLFNELQTNGLNLRFQKKTTSTLRIPKELIEEFEEKIQKHESIDRYLRYLLRTFRLFNYSGMVPNARKVKTEFKSQARTVPRLQVPAGSDQATW